MYAILASAFNGALGFIFRSLVIKFVIFGGLALLIGAIVPILQSSGLLPSAATMNLALSSVPSGLAYFLHAFAIDIVGPMLLTAWISRFVLRRIPFLN